MEPDWGQAYESAQRAWEPVDLDRTTFERHVRERLPAVNGDGLARTIHTTDLYLACACVNGVAGAFEAFERRYLADLGGVLRAIDTKLAFLKERYRREFEEALVAALAVLSERERVVWRLNLVGGASHARIASMYRVNQSTVTRWVAVARGRVWKELRRHLCARLGIAST